MFVQDKLDSSGDSLPKEPVQEVSEEQEDQFRQEELDNSVEMEESENDYC